MKIINIDGYRDGGTIKLETTDGIFTINNRLNTDYTTLGKIFNGYPKDDNSNIVIEQDKIKLEIIEGLENYNKLSFGNFDWKPRVLELIGII